MDKISETFKETFEKIKNTKHFAIILIIGIALLVFSDMSFFVNKETPEKDTSAAEFNMSDYESKLEKRLRDMLSQTKNVENVSVMITFSDCGKNIYLKEEQTENNESTTKDNSKPALKNDTDGGESPVLIKTELPTVAGVLIAAKGADDPVVCEKLIAAAAAILDIRQNKVRILPK